MAISPQRNTLSSDPADDGLEEPRAILPRSPLLKARNITKLYGPGCDHCLELTGPDHHRNTCPRCHTVVACQQIDFDLFPGEVLGVVGESGSGKSTVVKLLHFDMAPTAGEMFLTPGDRGGQLGLEVAGRDCFRLSTYHQRQLRNTLLGIVYQHPHLGLRMNISAGGNIAERLLMADWRHVGRIRKRAGHLLQKTEVPIERMDDPPSAFSGGMQQRVQIAKALSNTPILLLLDEVTTGLDVSVQARVLDLVRSLQGELDLATIVVSHDLGVIRMLTTRTLVMKDGRIVETGLTDQVLEDPQHPYTQLLVSSVL
jgi:putative phosphonate transport system ATP-binding protein